MQRFKNVMQFFLVASSMASFSLLVWQTSHDVDRPLRFGVSDISGVVYSGQQSSESVTQNTVTPTPQQTAQLQSHVQVHPFDAGQPKAVVILTYQRSGSTFLGQLFNRNPDAFYMYEPLDSLYTAMYGTKTGWNVPTDITNLWNGSERILPKHEVNAVSSFLCNLFTCSVDSWPTETLKHRFWTTVIDAQLTSIDYGRCLWKHRLTAVDCHVHTTPFCGDRFGKWPRRQDECRRLLTDEKYRDGYRNRNVSMQFQIFANCSQAIRREVEENCLAMLKSACGDKKIRAVKTVRATMESMEHLLRTLPNARVIHLIRDPRAVALSRKEFDLSASGHYSNERGADKMLVEAKLHCRTVARDIGVKEQLSVKFPGRIYTVVYEDVVRDLLAAAQKIYRFIDEPVHPKTVE